MLLHGKYSSQQQETVMASEAHKGKMNAANKNVK